MWKVLVFGSGPAAGSFAGDELTLAIVRIWVRKTGREAASSLEEVRRAAMVVRSEWRGDGEPVQLGDSFRGIQSCILKLCVAARAH